MVFVNGMDTHHCLRWDGRACPNGYTAQGPKALAWSWDFQKRCTLRPRCGIKPGAIRAEAPQTEPMTMRFYNQQHRFYCGVDLHARSMYLCVRDPRDLLRRRDGFVRQRALLVAHIQNTNSQYNLP